MQGVSGLGEVVCQWAEHGVGDIMECHRQEVVQCELQADASDKCVGTKSVQGVFYFLCMEAGRLAVY